MMQNKPRFCFKRIFISIEFLKNKGCILATIFHFFVRLIWGRGSAGKIDDFDTKNIKTLIFFNFGLDG